MNKRDDIIGKIRALTQKTVANGATEAEADAAVRMVQKLMREYSLSMEDIDQVAGDKYGVGSRKGPNWYRGDKYRNSRGHKIVSWHHVSRCYGAIARLCDVKYWRDDVSRDLSFFGSAIDVEMAFYLADVLKAAMDAEWRSYTIRYSTVKGKAGFMHAMARRLNERMNALSDVRDRVKADASGSKYALVLLKKDAIVDARYARYLSDRGMTVETTKLPAASLTHLNGIAEGYRAGDRVGLHREVKDGIGVKPKELKA